MSNVHTNAMMEFEARKKSATVAYLLWFLLGFLGAHRLYAGKIFSGILQFVVHGLGWLTVAIFVGYLFLGIWAVWWVIDAFLIPGWIRNRNLELARSLRV